MPFVISSSGEYYSGSDKGDCEVSVGVHVGQPWSHEMHNLPDAAVFICPQGNTYGWAIANARLSGVAEDPGSHVSALHGN